MKSVDPLYLALDEDGIVVLPEFINGARLQVMQYAFSRALEQLRANSIDGYEKTERLRDVIEHPLLLDQGFLELGLDPNIIALVGGYVGPQFQLVECKGWRSRVTRRDWHGWHGDAWYGEQPLPDAIPRELKVGLYLTDVTSGGLAYVKGSHRQRQPRLRSRKEGIGDLQGERLHVCGAAGTVVVFDTSGIHRQSDPISQTRHALFYCYHDPAVNLQAEDIAANRYGPLRLNAAFLGNLTSEQQRILGFGDKRHFVRGFQPRNRHPLAHAVFSCALEASLWAELYFEPVLRRIRAMRENPPSTPVTARNDGKRKPA